MAEKPKKSRFLQKIVALLMLLTGGAGISSWKFKDYPLVGDALAAITGDKATGDNSLSEIARSGVSRLVDSSRDSTRPGVYEIRIDELKLDPKVFRAGQTVDLQARVRSIDSQGVERIAWDSADNGTQRAVVGRDQLTATWANRPFKLGWSPGEVLIIEVYGKKLFKDQVYFRTNMEHSSSFPLKSGTQTLVNLLHETPKGNPEENRVVLTSQRVGDRPNGPVVPPDPIARNSGDSLFR